MGARVPDKSGRLVGVSLSQVVINGKLEKLHTGWRVIDGVWFWTMWDKDGKVIDFE